MAAHFTAADLRALADMVDAINEATRRTGVVVKGWQGEHLMLKDHAIRLEWRETGGEGAQVGHYLGHHYVVEYPDAP